MAIDCFYITDSLEIHPQSETAALAFVSLHDIGIHFERFDGRRFVPNPEKKIHYPDDDASQFKQQ